jgi:hypothetical protein
MFSCCEKNFSRTQRRFKYDEGAVKFGMHSSVQLKWNEDLWYVFVALATALSMQGRTSVVPVRQKIGKYRACLVCSYPRTLHSWRNNIRT